ncbi:MAG: sodium:solute symporter [Blastocatellia bacterium]
MIQVLFVFLYLIAVLYIGIFAFRRRDVAASAEGYFLAGRSLGVFVFLMSLFGTNMTAFALLGSSGHAFANGIVTYGLMASSSALVVSLSLFLIGTRVWALGKKYGFMTPVQMFRDRWECGHIGTVITVVQAALLVPYIIIGVMGGGTTLAAISNGAIPYWAGGALVAMVVMSYVFFGGMRGTALVNAFQTILFLCFGAIALAVIGAGMGGFAKAVNEMTASPATAALLTRERISPRFFFSYTFIPLSSICFPHMMIFCLTARRVQHFKKTVILYPLCMLAIWVPAVFLGVMANRAVEVPAIRAKLEARRALANGAATLTPEQKTELRAKSAGDDILVRLLEFYAPWWLVGLLGAGIMAAVMASDSQILALSTMFTEDLFAFYGGRKRFGEAAQVRTGHVFVVIITVIAYLIALRWPQSIFDLAVQYAFSGYSTLMPLLVGALFWRRSTKWGALAVTLWAAGAVIATAVFQAVVPPSAPGTETAYGVLFGETVIARTPAGTAVFGFMPVVPMVIVAAVLMIVVSLLTKAPAETTIRRYFDQ